MKNKYLILSALLLSLAFASCKKQYSCLCVVNYEQTGYYTLSTSSTQAIDSKTTKRRASQICAHSEKQLLQNAADYKTASQTVSASCAVK